MQFATLTYNLEDSDIIDDLKIINKNKAYSVSVHDSHFVSYLMLAMDHD